MKTYKQMNYSELLAEEERIKILLLLNKKPFTQKQNKKYLSKIQKELKRHELSR